VESLEWLDQRKLLVKQADGLKILELREGTKKNAEDEETSSTKKIEWEWKTMTGDLVCLLFSNIIISFQFSFVMESQAALWPYRPVAASSF
jgi:hypothetical protein